MWRGRSTVLPFKYLRAHRVQLCENNGEDRGEQGRSKDGEWDILMTRGYVPLPHPHNGEEETCDGSISFGTNDLSLPVCPSLSSRTYRVRVKTDVSYPWSQGLKKSFIPSTPS